MNILQLLKQPIFNLPKSYPTNNFPEFLESCYKEFLKCIDGLSEGTIVPKVHDNRMKLEELCFTIINSVNIYYSGHPSKAYSEFEKGIHLVEKFLFPENAGSVVGNMLTGYRARNGSTTLYERKDLFHVPFEKREFVTTQRFSIPGYPCLYLSNSVYTCWQELRNPDISKMQVSRFQFNKQKLKILDLSLTPSDIIQILETGLIDEMTTKNGAKVKIPSFSLDSQDFMTLDFLMIWPLIAACSIKVKTENGNFKPEYIIPQFLLQWITHTKQVDGIKYFSIIGNAPNEYAIMNQQKNYAIPVKKIKATGYCQELTQLFELTEPVSWDILSITQPDIVLHDPEKVDACIRQLGLDHIGAILELIKGKKVHYLRTIFGKIEMELSTMQLGNI